MRCVGDEPALARVRLPDRPKGPSRQDPRRNANEDHDGHVGNDERDPDLVYRRPVGRLGRLFVGQLRSHVEGRSERRRDNDVEDDAEESEHEGEEPDVQQCQAGLRAGEHQINSGARSR